MAGVGTTGWRCWWAALGISQQPGAWAFGEAPLNSTVIETDRLSLLFCPGEGAGGSRSWLQISLQAGSRETTLTLAVLRERTTQWVSGSAMRGGV